MLPWQPPGAQQTGKRVRSAHAVSADGVRRDARSSGTLGPFQKTTDKEGFCHVGSFLRDRARAGEGQREGEPRKPTKQAPGSEPSSTEPDAGPEPTNREIAT